MYINIELILLFILCLTALMIMWARARKRALLEIKKRSEIEIAKAKEKFLEESEMLKHEYERKNREKTIELEVLRKKIKILKKNQYDPRKDPTGSHKPKAFTNRKKNRA